MSASAQSGSLGSQPTPGGGRYGTFFLGRYRVVDEIGIGGMASVHLARADGPGGFQKWVAIKRIHPHLVEDDQFIHMFLDEARIAARISHANVAQVFDLGEGDGTYWIAMEYLHGEPLREVMRCVEDGFPLPSTDIAARIVADAAEGLHAAHDLKDKGGQLLNLVHRDVTPHNLFLTYDGNVKVVDFGIAKVAGRLSQTRAGTLKGKLAYMSPEQVRGGEIDRRTDIFALGVVLWELTTGHRLFRMESDLETLEKVQACIVPSPSAVVPDYPAELESIVMRALAKAPEQRFQTARELSRALQQHLLRRGVFIGPEDVSGYVRRIFGDRIKKRDAHLRWAAEVTQTINVDDLKRPRTDEPSEVSAHTYASDVQRTASTVGDAPAGRNAVTARPPAAPSLRHTMPLPAPRPAAGAPLAATTPDGPKPLPSFDGPLPAPRPLPAPEDDDDDDDENVETVIANTRSLGTEFEQMRAQARPVLPAAGAPPPQAPHQRTQTLLGMQAPPAPPQAFNQRAQTLLGMQPPPAPHPAQPASALATAPVAAMPSAAALAQPGAPASKGKGPLIAALVAVGLLAAGLIVSVGLLLFRGKDARSPASADPALASAQAAPSASAPHVAPATPVPTAAASPAVTATAAPPTTTTTATPTAVPPSALPDKKPVTSPPATAATHEKKPDAPAAGTGYLTVVCNPYCDSVTAGGRSLGPSPVVKAPLPAGPARVTLRKSGMAAKMLQVTIVAGETTPLRVKME
ncbi:MAG: serine/threonine protein kinase [Polyangiaceae bacterium]|nr:serine/threonine protein kinase [Polyangiaceae bacterium]